MTTSPPAAAPATSDLSNQDGEVLAAYLQKRQALIQQERALRFDFHKRSTPTAEEISADSLLDAMRKEQLAALQKSSPNDFSRGAGFYSSKLARAKLGDGQDPVYNVLKKVRAVLQRIHLPFKILPLGSV